MKIIKGLGLAIITLVVLVGVARACFYIPPLTCEEGYHVSDNQCVPNVPPPCDNDCVTPSPVEESPTPEPCRENCGQGNTPENPHTNTTEAPAPATCNIPFEAPRAWYTKVNGKVVFNWAEDTSVDKFSIVYGYSPTKLEFGVDNLPSTSRSLDINGLDTTHHTWFEIQAWKNGCMEPSQIIDP